MTDSADGWWASAQGKIPAELITEASVGDSAYTGYRQRFYSKKQRHEMSQDAATELEQASKALILHYRTRRRSPLHDRWPEGQASAPTRSIWRIKLNLWWSKGEDVAVIPVADLERLEAALWWAEHPEAEQWVTEAIDDPSEGSSDFDWRSAGS